MGRAGRVRHECDDRWACSTESIHSSAGARYFLEQILAECTQRYAELFSRLCESFHDGPSQTKAKYANGLDGSPLTITDLRAPGTKRWVIRRKAELIAAVRGGLPSIEEACSRYLLTVDELLSWQASLDQLGLAGLRTTRIQQFGRNGGLDRLRHRGEFSYVVSPSGDIDLK